MIATEKKKKTTCGQCEGIVSDTQQAFANDIIRNAIIENVPNFCDLKKLMRAITVEGPKSLCTVSGMCEGVGI